MDGNPPNDFRSVPQHSAEFENVPQRAAEFRSLPNVSATFRSVPKLSERKENHTLTVREVSRMFEAAGVARSERSIVNWCQRNGLGAAKLDAYFDPNERKYFITPESVEVAIAEERAKGEQHGRKPEGVGKLLHSTEAPQPAAVESPTEIGKVKKMETELLDLKITNRAKDYFIEELRKEREAFVAERQEYVTQLMSFNRKVGELETQLLRLAEPRGTQSRRLEVRGDSDDAQDLSVN